MNISSTSGIFCKVFFPALTSALLLTGCGALRNSPKHQLGDDYYEFRQKGTTYRKTFVQMKEDTIRIISTGQPPETIISKSNNDQFFLKRSFDVDVMTVGFKYRPATSGLPRQINTDFNGNVFLGYRLDRFRVRYNNTPAGVLKSYHHRALTVGTFGGLGSTAVTPWTTSNRTIDEYNGFILSRGIAVMFGVNNLTVGVGAGWDSLTDRDKHIWIYQNKPWYGLMVGLNLN